MGARLYYLRKYKLYYSILDLFYTTIIETTVLRHHLYCPGV